MILLAAKTNRPVPLFTFLHGWQGVLAKITQRFSVRVGPGHVVGQITHHFPLVEQVLHRRGVFKLQGPQDQAWRIQGRREYRTRRGDVMHGNKLPEVGGHTIYL